MPEMATSEGDGLWRNCKPYRFRRKHNYLHELDSLRRAGGDAVVSVPRRTALEHVVDAARVGLKLRRRPLSAAERPAFAEWSSADRRGGFAFAMLCALS